jgi:hypothetical protein
MAAQENWDDWADSETGGTSCACGRSCAERDYQGNPARGPRAFCAADERYIGSAIRQLPETYARIALLLAKTGQQEEKVSGSRDAPVPVNLVAETFMRHIILVALSWEDQVRGVANLSDPDRCPACRGEGTVTAAGFAATCRDCRGTGKVGTRDGVALQRACELLAGRDQDRPGYLITLLSLEPEEKRRPVPGFRRIADLQPGTRLIIDTSGDAWEDRERDGTDAGLEFLALNSRARGMLGLSLQRHRITEVPCDGCTQRTLIQREAIGGGWEPVARCTNCPRSYIGAQFELLMGRVYQAQAAALGGA